MKLKNIIIKNINVNTNKIPDGLRANKAGYSAWQIKRDFPQSTDGLYWIQNPNINSGNPIQIYCDMTTLGGGWTLVVQSCANMTPEHGLFYNELNPPSTLVNHETVTGVESYSILGWADYIKKTASASEAKFDYMFDAAYRGRNGAAYTANQNYSFVEQYDNIQPLENSAFDRIGWRKNITELDHFYAGTLADSATWYYADDGIEARMPHYNGPSFGGGVLTTDGRNGGWWGTIISNGGFTPAPWMNGGCFTGTISAENPGDLMANPRVIWYWVR